jgi:hypothetical protein
VPRITVSVDQLDALANALRRLVRLLRRVALVGAAGAAAVLLHGLDDLSAADAVLAAVLLAPPVAVVLFAQGVQELAELPGRLRRMPGEGQERLAELTRLAGEARTARAGRLPLLLWRLRGSVGSVRELAGIAFPLRVFTPWFLVVTGVSLLLCALLAVAGLIALALLVG